MSPPATTPSVNSFSAAADRVRSAYVHVPFCIHRCGYCDFTVIAGRDDLIATYLQCLEIELRQKFAEPQPVDTLFLGGGTPSYLPARDLQSLFELLQRWFPLNPGAEFSIECNPDGLTEDRMKVMRAGGINRVSLGVQSLNTQHLQTLERTHSATEIEQVVSSLQAHGLENISLDLIFGVPGQTLDEWQSTLVSAVALDPQHISTYGLTFEKGTAFWTRLQRGQIQPVAEETEREMYDFVMQFLPDHGFRQYELSNFAKPGFECRHNQVYWRAEPFYGIGPGAAEFVGSTRRCNARSVTGWIQKLQAGESPVTEVDELDSDLRAREAVMVGLRQVSGIHEATFEQRFGTSIRNLAPEAYDSCLTQGWLEQFDGYLRLTRDGRFVADTVMSEFF